jgi:hypothetical protein
MWAVAVAVAAAVAAEVVAPETVTQHRRGRREQGLGQALVLLMVPRLPALPQNGSCLTLVPMPVLRYFQS